MSDDVHKQAFWTDVWKTTAPPLNVSCDWCNEPIKDRKFHMYVKYSLIQKILNFIGLWNLGSEYDCVCNSCSEKRQ